MFRTNYLRITITNTNHAYTTKYTLGAVVDKYGDLVNSNLQGTAESLRDKPIPVPQIPH
jgi:hypothetical protein